MYLSNTKQFRSTRFAFVVDLKKMELVIISRETKDRTVSFTLSPALRMDHG